uniref:Uncharacterized protein n=1 Tax=Romanomermis culicivorax TaxID=13658 RepID=A0A915K5M6_ROMCU
MVISLHEQCSKEVVTLQEIFYIHREKYGASHSELVNEHMATLAGMTSSFFLWFFVLHAAHCFDNYYWYNNRPVDQEPVPRNPFLTYDANGRPSLEKLTGVQYGQTRLLADQPLLPADNRRIGGVVKTNSTVKKNQRAYLNEFRRKLTESL